MTHVIRTSTPSPSLPIHKLTESCPQTRFMAPGPVRCSVLGLDQPMVVPSTSDLPERLSPAPCSPRSPHSMTRSFSLTGGRRRPHLMSLQQSSRDKGVFKYEETKAQSGSQSADATEPKSHRPPAVTSLPSILGNYRPHCYSPVGPWNLTKTSQ